MVHARADLNMRPDQVLPFMAIMSRINNVLTLENHPHRFILERIFASHKKRNTSHTDTLSGYTYTLLDTLKHTQRKSQTKHTLSSVISLH